MDGFMVHCCKCDSGFEIDPDAVMCPKCATKTGGTQPTDAQQLKPKMLTRDEMWEHLKGLPTPSTNVLLSGGMMMYYVDACYDYMCQHFVR